MLVFLLFVLDDSCILPVCSGLPFKHPFSNISLCFCLSKNKTVKLFKFLQSAIMLIHIPW